MSFDFLVTSLIVIASPGTGVLYTLAAGLSGGSRASVVAAFGCTLGIVPHMVAAVMGLAALLHTSALAFQTVKYLGVAYLLYMAWSTLREHGALHVETEVERRSAHRVIVSAILVNILNPKLSIFFFAFLPQFVTAGERDPLARMLASGCASSVLTNCGRKARKKIESLGFRMLIRIASIVTCMKLRAPLAFSSTLSAPRSFKVLQAIHSR